MAIMRLTEFFESMADYDFKPICDALFSSAVWPQVVFILLQVRSHHDNFAPSRQFRPIKYNTFTPTFTAPIISTPFYMIKLVPSLTKKNLFYQNAN